MFIFFLFLFPSFILANQCGVYPPYNSSYCFNYNKTENSHCCYVYNEEVSFCMLMDQINDSVSINGTQYKVECNTENDLPLIGSFCGDPVSKPMDVNDCSKYSNKSSPCCLYNNSYTGVTGCFVLGELTSTSLITYDKELIFCQEDYIKPLFGKYWIFGISLLSFITL